MRLKFNIACFLFSGMALAMDPAPAEPQKIHPMFLAVVEELEKSTLPEEFKTALHELLLTKEALLFTKTPEELNAELEKHWDSLDDEKIGYEERSDRCLYLIRISHALDKSNLTHYTCLKFIENRFLDLQSQKKLADFFKKTEFRDKNPILNTKALEFINPSSVEAHPEDPCTTFLRNNILCTGIINMVDASIKKLNDVRSLTIHCCELLSVTRPDINLLSYLRFLSGAVLEQDFTSEF